MAGSFKHITKKNGKLRKPEKILIDNLGDAYETIEEMYGMIWYLACIGSNITDPVKRIEMARILYEDGLKFSKVTLSKKSNA